MALMDHFPRWLRNRLKDGSRVLRLHDAIEAAFVELEADQKAIEDDTYLDDASERGLVRWGRDLNEPRLPHQDLEQYRARLKQIKHGQMVDDEGIRLALDKWDVPYELVEYGDDQTFWDLGFYDTVSLDVVSRAYVIIFEDPFADYAGTQEYWDQGFYDLASTAEQIAEQIVLMNNAVNEAKRVTAKGVRVIAILPNSLAA